MCVVSNNNGRTTNRKHGLATALVTSVWIGGCLLAHSIYTIPPSQPMFVSISAAVETDADATDAAEFCDEAAEAVEIAAGAVAVPDACDAETPAAM